jgi:hypothetical protein
LNRIGLPVVVLGLDLLVTSPLARALWVERDHGLLGREQWMERHEKMV